MGQALTGPLQPSADRETHEFDPDQSSPTRRGCEDDRDITVTATAGVAPWLSSHGWPSVAAGGSHAQGHTVPSGGLNPAAESASLSGVECQPQGALPLSRAFVVALCLSPPAPPRCGAPCGRLVHALQGMPWTVQLHVPRLCRPQREHSRHGNGRLADTGPFLSPPQSPLSKGCQCTSRSSPKGTSSLGRNPPSQTSLPSWVDVGPEGFLTPRQGPRLGPAAGRPSTPQATWLGLQAELRGRARSQGGPRCHPGLLAGAWPGPLHGVPPSPPCAASAVITLPRMVSARRA